MGAKLIDLTGQRFGRWVVLEYVGEKWKCQCDCGTRRNVRGKDLRRNVTRSCGCLQRETAAKSGKANTAHGHIRGGKETAVYRCWKHMRQRCRNPKHKSWPDYGGRGIKVCESWQASFENFLADMGDKSPGLSIDRIDNDGDYEPSNCRWATAKEQRANQRPANG